MSNHCGYKKNYKTPECLNEADCEALLSEFSDDYSDLVALGHRIGAEGLNEVLKLLGGCKIHIPTPETFWQRLYREVRDRMVRDKFNGRNYAELGTETGLTPMQVRRIVHGRSASDSH